MLEDTDMAAAQLQIQAMTVIHPNSRISSTILMVVEAPLYLE